MMTKPSEKLASYLASLLDAKPERCEGVFSRTADNFEDDLLEFEAFPPGYFDFMLTLLSDVRFFSRAGLWNFLLVLSTESEKLQGPHYRMLAQVIGDHYIEYQDKDLCLAVCDFIARSYEASRARHLLLQLKELEAGRPLQLQGFADEGLKLLEREVSRSMKSRH